MVGESIISESETNDGNIDMDSVWTNFAHVTTLKYP